jgi:hypothetical protein
LGYSWKSFDHVHEVITDFGVMEYRFVPAQLSPQTAPTLIILHGHGNYPPARAAYADWNVFNPLDNYGAEGFGSWWLGEGGARNTMDMFDAALEAALAIVSQTVESARLFFYGSSMGGFGALLHGPRVGALGVYANVPQVKLLNTTYSELGMKKFFRPIFNSDEEDEFNDLRTILAGVIQHPLYFICENRYGQERYLEEHCLSLIEFFNENNINYHLEIIPTSGHNKNRRLSEVKKLFEQYCLHGND